MIDADAFAFDVVGAKGRAASGHFADPMPALPQTMLVLAGETKEDRATRATLQNRSAPEP